MVLLSKLYMNRDRAASKKLIEGLERDGFKAIMLTVDAAVPGNREIDKRAKGFTVCRLYSQKMLAVTSAV